MSFTITSERIWYRRTWFRRYFSVEWEGFTAGPPRKWFKILCTGRTLSEARGKLHVLVEKMFP